MSEEKADSGRDYMADLMKLVDQYHKEVPAASLVAGLQLVQHVLLTQMTRPPAPKKEEE